MGELDRAIAIAAEAHATQTDKAGQPYILHPLRVMLDPELPAGDAQVVAVLHDVVEDTGDAGLIADFEPHIREALDALTRREGELYVAYIRRAAANPLARIVKLADIRDNISPARRDSLPPTLAARYEVALYELTAARSSAPTPQEGTPDA